MLYVGRCVIVEAPPTKGRIMSTSTRSSALAALAASTRSLAHAGRTASVASDHQRAPLARREDVDDSSSLEIAQGPLRSSSDRGSREAETHLDVRGAGRSVRGRQILEAVTFTARRGEVVAIAGGSGAGKSTLLELLAGRHGADQGVVAIDGRAIDPADATVGYVPQDDIVHGSLPLLRTLEYAAALRLRVDRAEERRALARRVLAAVGLSEHLDTRVESLSGGQRKRACIAVELLGDPELFLLDEPTSGLDPATAASLLDLLHELAARGATVVLTTHAPSDLDRCDRIVFLAPGGRHVFTGTADEARACFGVRHLADAYEKLAASPSVEGASVAESTQRGRTAVDATGPPVRRPGWLWQWTASSARTAELIVRNRLTLAILIGSPVFVIAMLAAVFRPGSFDAAQPLGAAQLVFWVVFSAFFFGLTYGLLQVVTERDVFRRERDAGLRPGAYLAAKMTVLAPFLAMVDAAMLWVLDQNRQLPVQSTGHALRLWGALIAVSSAALLVGLAASALVCSASQATLALPMLCFPQVLFAGAIVPVNEMALPGRVLSAGLVGRWGFESFGRLAGLGEVRAGSWSTAGFATTFTGSAVDGVVVLGAIALIAWAATDWSLRTN